MSKPNEKRKTPNDRKNKLIFFVIIIRHEESLKRLRAEENRRYEQHCKTRSETMVKYFAEKVAPDVHDAAAGREGFDIWKEDFLRFK
jgi:hypothetical protein